MATQWQKNDIIPDPNTGKDRWQIDKIYKGGMGIIYIVYDTNLREAFAAKTFQDQFLKTDFLRQRFLREAEAWVKLDMHENVVRARFVQIIRGKPYLFLEYVPDGDLSRWIGTLRLDLKRILQFAIQFCYGMEHALSKGIQAHRDIKPANCMITQEGTLKISDFGLAKVFDEIDVAHDQIDGPAVTNSRLTLTGNGAGTPQYMAPEQFDDVKRVDLRADIYSFGIMLFEMVTGFRPFEGKSFDELRRKHQNDTPQDLKAYLPSNAAGLTAIVSKCLMKLPEHRYQDFRALHIELEEMYRCVIGTPPPIPADAKPLNAIALANKAGALASLGKHEMAIEICKHALSLVPNLISALINMGIALRELGRYDEALTCYDDVLSLDPKHAMAWSEKGVALGHIGKTDEEMKCYDRALSLDSGDKMAWYNKALLFGKLGKYDKEIECYNQAILLDPGFAEAWFNKGAALANIGKVKDALFCFQKAYQLGLSSAAEKITICEQLIRVMG